MFCLFVLGASAIISYNVHEWRYADKYAAKFAEIRSTNLRSTMELCQSFMSPKLAPYLGQENMDQWTDLCLGQAKEMLEHYK